MKKWILILVTLPLTQIAAAQETCTPPLTSACVALPEEAPSRAEKTFTSETPEATVRVLQSDLIPATEDLALAKAIAMSEEPDGILAKVEPALSVQRNVMNVDLYLMTNFRTQEIFLPEAQPARRK